MKYYVLYLWFHKKLYVIYGYDVITKEEIYIKLGEMYKIPKNLRPPVLKEMVNLGMLNRIGHNEFKINPYIIDPQENTSEIYGSLKMY